MKDLLFGRAPTQEELPGSRIDLPIDWGMFRVVLWLSTPSFLAIWGYALVRGVWHSTRSVVMWGLCGVAIIVLMVGGIIYRYRHAAGVIFTSEGLWTPSWSSGRFRPWAELADAKLRDGKNIELRYPDGVYKLYAVGFKDPFAVSRLVRQHTAGRVGADLPVAGER